MLLFLLGLLIVCSFTTVGLAAVWAATSGRHWFVRTVVVAAPLSVLLLVPAYEPLVAFAVEAAIVALGLFVAQLRKPRAPSPEAGGASAPSRISFSIGSLLWLMVLVAATAAVVARLPRLTWLGWVNTVSIGVAGGLAVLLGVWLVRGRRRWWLRVPLVFGASLIVAAALAATDYLLDSMTGRGAPWPPGSPPGPQPAVRATAHWLWLGILPLTTIVSGLVLLAWSPRLQRARAGRSARALRIGLQLGTATLVLILPTYALYRMLTPDPLLDAAKDHPVPNGYDELLAAAATIQSPVLDDYEAAPRARLEKTLAARKTAFDRFRRALALDSQAHINYQDSSLQQQLTDVQAFRGLARAMMAEAQFAEWEERFADAASIYADNIELGQRMSEGGMVIQLLVGVAIQSMGVSGLTEVRHHLSPEAAREIAARLVEINARRAPFEEFRIRDRVWIQHAMGWQGRILLALEELPGKELETKETGGITAARYAYYRAATLIRLLIAELAIHAYRVDHGQLPDELEQLLPEYLPHVPLDPFDEEPLRYVRRDGEHLVYSVGADRRDDRGRPPPDETFIIWEGGDVSLDGWHDWFESR